MHGILASKQAKGEPTYAFGDDKFAMLDDHKTRSDKAATVEREQPPKQSKGGQVLQLLADAGAEGVLLPLENAKKYYTKRQASGKDDEQQGKKPKPGKESKDPGAKAKSKAKAAKQ
eukprot:s1890_g5.t1